VPLNSNLFPGVPSNVRVHYGFSIAHALAAIPVLDAVRIGLATYPTTSVTTVGHSLGGALALLYGIFLPLHLPSSTTFKTFTYGQPRVANDAFATFVDSPASRVQLARVTNREDPVPILPPRLVGFTHSSGEVHIDDPTGVWYSCSGQDNSDAMCSVGDATSILDTDIADHSGPYGPVMMGCN
jgi:predicted lipase